MSQDAWTFHGAGHDYGCGVGDTIETNIGWPCSQRVRVRLNTPEAAAEGPGLIHTGRWQKVACKWPPERPDWRNPHPE